MRGYHTSTRQSRTITGWAIRTRGQIRTRADSLWVQHQIGRVEARTLNESEFSSIKVTGILS
jgi:hypothetical protein